MMIIKKSFTLVEVAVGTAIFAMMALALSTALISLQRSRDDQQITVLMTQEASWALELMTNEIRDSDGSVTQIQSGGSQLRLLRDASGDGADDTTDWYWFNGANLYRSEASGTGTTNPPNGSGVLLSKYLVANPSGDAMFSFPISGDSTLVQVEVTVRPKPAIAASNKNRNFTLRTCIRSRA